MKITKVFPNALEAARPINCETVQEAISILGITDELYQHYCKSDNFKITIEPTGKMCTTNGYPTNECVLTIEWH